GSWPGNRPAPATPAGVEKTPRTGTTAPCGVATEARPLAAVPPSLAAETDGSALVPDVDPAEPTVPFTPPVADAVWPVATDAGAASPRRPRPPESVPVDALVLFVVAAAVLPWFDAVPLVEPADVPEVPPALLACAPDSPRPRDEREEESVVVDAL